MIESAAVRRRNDHRRELWSGAGTLFRLLSARSVDPIMPLDISITRVAVTKPEDAKVVVSEDGSQTSGKQTEMGRKSLVPYGLYRAHGFFNPHFAKQTNVGSDDLALFWDALQMDVDLDRPLARGMTACQGLHVFSHESSLGNAPAQKLFGKRYGGNSGAPIHCRLLSRG